VKSATPKEKSLEYELRSGWLLLCGVLRRCQMRTFLGSIRKILEEKVSVLVRRSLLRALGNLRCIGLLW
jgi:hypothetical protein